MEFIASKSSKVSVTEEQEAFVCSKETILKIIEKNPDTVLAFDIVHEGATIGFALLHRFEEGSWFLWDYAIDKDFQNRGLGARALRELIEYMRKNHGMRVMTTTYIMGNEQAKRLYERVGFVVTDVVDEDDCHEVNMIYEPPKE